MSSERERQRLLDIVENIDRIDRYVVGLDRAALSADEKTADAVERCLQRITEAAIKIGPERMAEIAPDLPMVQVRGLGNILRHEYDLIDLEIVWNTITRSLPALRAACAAEALRRDTTR